MEREKSERKRSTKLSRWGGGSSLNNGSTETRIEKRPQVPELSKEGILNSIILYGKCCVGA